MSIRTRTSLRAFEAEYHEQERQRELERTAPLRAIAQRNAELEQQIAETEKKIVQQEVFSQPSKHLSEACTPYTKNLSVQQVTIAIGDAVAALKLHLDSQGIEITPAGLQKLGRVSELNQNIDATEPKNLITIWEYLEANRCLNSSDFKVVRQMQPAEPEKPSEAPAPVDVEKMDTSTREGQKAAHKAVFDQWMIESRQLWNQFVTHMRTVWSHPMMQEDQDAVGLYLYNTNAGITAKGLDKARQVVLGCLTDDEKLAQEIENDNRSVGGYAVRQDIAARIRAVMK